MHRHCYCNMTSAWEKSRVRLHAYPLRQHIGVTTESTNAYPRHNHNEVNGIRFEQLDHERWTKTNSARQAPHPHPHHQPGRDNPWFEERLEKERLEKERIVNEKAWTGRLDEHAAASLLECARRSRERLERTTGVKSTGVRTTRAATWQHHCRERLAKAAARAGTPSPRAESKGSHSTDGAKTAANKRSSHKKTTRTAGDAQDPMTPRKRSHGDDDCHNNTDAEPTTPKTARRRLECDTVSSSKAAERKQSPSRVANPQARVCEEECLKIVACHAQFKVSQKAGHDLRDSYEHLRRLLGVVRGATSATVKKAYHNKMKRVHPDRAPKGLEGLCKHAAQCVNDAREALFQPSK